MRFQTIPHLPILLAYHHLPFSPSPALTQHLAVWEVFSSRTWQVGIYLCFSKFTTRGQICKIKFKNHSFGFGLLGVFIGGAYFVLFVCFICLLLLMLMFEVAGTFNKRNPGVNYWSDPVCLSECTSHLQCKILSITMALCACLNLLDFYNVRCGGGNVCALLEVMSYILKWDVWGFYSKDPKIIAWYCSAVQLRTTGNLFISGMLSNKCEPLNIICHSRPSLSKGSPKENLSSPDLFRKQIKFLEEKLRINTEWTKWNVTVDGSSSSVCWCWQLELQEAKLSCMMPTNFCGVNVLTLTSFIQAPNKVSLNTGFSEKGTPWELPSRNKLTFTWTLLNPHCRSVSCEEGTNGDPHIIYLNSDIINQASKLISYLILMPP